MTILYHEQNFPIYQTATARAANRGYFKQLGSTQRGITRAILGRVHARQLEECSYMIVRLSTRDPYVAQHIQKTGYGMRAAAYRGPRTMYKTARSTYVIARQYWKDGSIEEIAAYDLPELARAAFKQMFGVSATGNQRDVNEETAAERLSRTLANKDMT